MPEPDYPAILRELNLRIQKNPEAKLRILQAFYEEMVNAGEGAAADYVFTLRAIVMARPTPKKILILAANPIKTTKLRLDEEVREIDTGLHRSKQRDKFDLQQRWAVRVRDIRQAMLDENPHVVHFSGHGGMEGLMFENQAGKAQFVDIEALAELFELFKDQVECVLLNACYSAPQAEAISRHIPYVIGMSEAIGDRAAIEFAIGFYDALGAGRSIEDAFKFGRNAIRLMDIPEHLTPVLHKRETTPPSS